MQTAAEITSFLNDAGWGEATRTALSSDWPARRYTRLTLAGQVPSSAILICADADQKTESFVQLSFLLRRIGIAAPEIYASDILRGMALMEDFGDQSCGKAIAAGQDRAPFDVQAAEILARLHEGFEQTMLGALKTQLYNAALFTDQATLFLDHYFPRLFRRACTARERSRYVEAWYDVLSPLDAMPRSLLLRDFMPDTVMILPATIWGQKMGVLAFHYAGIGPIAYDLGSWCEEVRYDGGLERLPAVVEAYCARRPSVDPVMLLRGAKILLAQRLARILGELASRDDGARMQRVWRALQLLLKDEALRPVRRWFASCAPPGA